jgi:hypothetical protein
MNQQDSVITSKPVKIKSETIFPVSPHGIKQIVTT